MSMCSHKNNIGRGLNLVCHVVTHSREALEVPASCTAHQQHYCCQAATAATAKYFVFCFTPGKGMCPYMLTLHYQSLMESSTHREPQTTSCFKALSINELVSLSTLENLVFQKITSYSRQATHKNTLPPPLECRQRHCQKCTSLLRSNSWREKNRSWPHSEFCDIAYFTIRWQNWSMVWHRNVISHLVNDIVNRYVYTKTTSIVTNVK